MNIILTGSSGFVGTKLSQALNHLGHNVFGIDKIKYPKPVGLTKVQLDLCKTEEYSLKLIDLPDSIDLLIHCAAAKGDFQLTEEDFYRDNVIATKGVLKILNQFKIQNVIHYSTVSVYGHGNIQKDEKADLKPNNAYGSTKLVSEKLMISWFKEDADFRTLTVLRPSVIYGEGNYANMYNLLKQLNSRFPISVGSGDYVKSMIALENLIDITTFCMSRLKGLQIYNTIDEPYYKLSRVMKIISEVEGFNQPKIIVPKLLALLLAMPFELLSVLTKRDLGITRDRIRKFSMATDYQSQLIRKKGYIQQYSTEDRLKNMAKWYLYIKNKTR